MIISAGRSRPVSVAAPVLLSYRDHRALHSLPTRRSSDLTVRVTTWPVPRSPLPLVIPGPEVTIEATVGATVSICRVRTRLKFGPLGRSDVLSSPSFTVAQLRLNEDTTRSGVFCSAATD